MGVRGFFCLKAAISDDRFERAQSPSFAAWTSPAAGALLAESVVLFTIVVCVNWHQNVLVRATKREVELTVLPAVGFVT